jgi:hypothetical protein
VSSQQEQASPGGRRPGGSRPAGSPAGSSALKSAWKTGPDGRTVFRLMPPLVLWWAWLVFGVVNVADLVFQSRDWFSVEVTAGILVVTGAMYACALRPRVISDAVGLVIQNPFRDYLVPWSAVAGIFVGDSVEIQCRRSAPESDKTVYSWALYSPRRARARAELRTVGFGGRRSRGGLGSRARYEVPTPDSFARLPEEARQLASQHPSHVMAGELARRCDEARRGRRADGGLTNGALANGALADGVLANGALADGALADGVLANGVLAGSGVLTARWAWLPIAAVILPVALLVAVIAAR